MDELLAGDPALLPFVPYAGDASAERVEEAIRDSERLPRNLRVELLAALAVFARLLRSKFAALPPHAEQRIGSAGEAELQTWSDRVLGATSLDEVFAGPA